MWNIVQYVIGKRSISFFSLVGYNIFLEYNKYV